MKIFGEKASTNLIQTNQEVNKTSGNQQSTDVKLFKEGHVFTADILDIRKEQITIQLFGNQIIQAKLTDDIELTIGQRLQFLVKENNGEVVSIKPMHSEHFPLIGDTTMTRALQAANLPINEKSIDLVRQLMQQKMPIDKSTLQRLFQQLVTNNQAEVETIVFMNQYGVRPTKENIEQFTKYKNYEHRISVGIETVANQLVEHLSNLLEQNQNEKAFDYYNKLIASLTEEPTLEKQTNHKLPISSLFSEGESKQLLGLLDKINLGVEWKEGTVITQEQGLQEQRLQNQKSNQTSNQTPNQVQILQNKPLQNRTFSTSVTTTDLLRALSVVLENSEESELTNIKQLLTSPEYKKIISEHIKNRLFLNPTEVGQEKVVTTYYENIQTKLKSIQSITKEPELEENPLLKTTKGIQDNMEFMRQINQIFTYIQIPIQLKNQFAHSELYVLTDKEALKKNNGNIRALLHLDLAHLGLLDIYIDKQDQVINGQFYCSKSNITDLIEQNMGILIEALNSKGYQVYTQAMTSNKKVDFLDNLIQSGEHRLPIKRYSFDVRA